MAIHVVPVKALPPSAAADTVVAWIGNVGATESNNGMWWYDGAVWLQIGCCNITIPVIDPPADQAGPENVAFSFIPSALGSGITWTSTALPAGLTINPATGEISGTPTVTGTTSVSITATNTAGSDTETFNIVFAGPVVASGTETVAADTITVTYTSTSTATPGPLTLIRFTMDLTTGTNNGRQIIVEAAPGAAPIVTQDTGGTPSARLATGQLTGAAIESWGFVSGVLNDIFGDINTTLFVTDGTNNDTAAL